MIQLIGWIFICLLSMAYSDIVPEIDSKMVLEITAKTGEPDNSSTLAESVSTIDFSSSFTTEKIKKAISELPSTAEETISSDKTASTSQTYIAPEPAYMGEITITYQNTTPSLKEMTESNQTETSNSTPSNKNLYYDGQATTENLVSSDMTDKSSDLTVQETAITSTSSMGLTFEKEDIAYFINATIEENSASDDRTNGEISSISDQGNKNPEEQNTKRNESVQDVYTKQKSDTEVKEYTDIKIIDLIQDNKSNPIEIPYSESKNKQTENVYGMMTTVILPEISTKNREEHFALVKNEVENSNLKDFINISEDPVMVEGNTDKIISLSEKVGARITDYMVDSVSVDSTESINSTRNPKRIQEEETIYPDDRAYQEERAYDEERSFLERTYRERTYPEGKLRPSHPDPGYANVGVDLVRPYRPDPLPQYPYYRPTPDYRTPIIREDTDYTRPARPDPGYQRITFRPNYSSSKTSQEETSSKPSSQFATSSKPYRPSFNRPYHPPSSFGRPYRPDYHRPASKPTEDFSVTKISEIKGGSTQEEVSEQSRADYDYTRQSESVSTFTKTYQADVRPSPIKTDSAKPYRPTFDSEVSTNLKSTPPNDFSNENKDSQSQKVSKPDTSTTRPSSVYPRPGFGNSYHTSESSLKPFSVGTVTSAKNLTRVEFIKADCFDNHMKVTMRFNGTFNGLVYSSGYAQDSTCSYVNGSGRNHYEFYIRLNRCGTLGQQEVAEQRLRSASRRRQERAQYLVNTVTVQYNPVIEEDIDEHFRVTCEYGYDFWKTVTFPVVSVESSAVKIRTGSPVVFTLPPPQCNMEIRSGFGPSGTRIAGPVNVGDPLTLVIHMKSESTGFDILVSNCFAHNGAEKRLQLIDSNGCVVQDKLVSPFRGASSPDRSQQVTLYSYLKAFRFTGSPALYIECDVHMCHGSCPPQRCYWRHLYKRSVNELTTEVPVPTTPDNLISESISLFQALEVRHEEVDTPNLLPLRNSNGYETDDVVCLRTGGFAALLACLLLLLVLTTSAAVGMSYRMRKIKRFVEASESQVFVEFDGHSCK